MQFNKQFLIEDMNDFSDSIFGDEPLDEVEDEQVNEDIHPLIKDKNGNWIVNPELKSDNRNFKNKAEKTLQGSNVLNKTSQIEPSGYRVILYANAYYNQSDLSEVKKRFKGQAKALLSSSNTKIEITYNK